MKHLLILCLLLSAALARAELQIAVEGQPCVIGSTTDAGATATHSIQWYRNGVAIPECTAQVCTVPAELAVGDSVYFVRKITADGCIDNEGVSNELLITFKCGGGHGTRIGTACWADRNVDAPGAFTATPDAYGMFYQWNRHIGWANSGAVTGWNNTVDISATWTVDPLPCPVGWRLPTREEHQALVVAGGSPAANGSTWADVNDGGNAVASRFFGSKHTTCSLPSSMSGCVFLPAAGMRASNGAQYHGVNAYYWSTTQGNILNFTASTTTTIAFPKQYATPVRCVQ